MREGLLETARLLGLEIDVRRLAHQSAAPADTAAALGCDVRQVASSTVFIADGDPIVCLTSAGAAVDPGLLADALDVVEVRIATAAEVRAATGSCAEGVPPFGHGLPVVLDEPILDRGDVIWAPGGDGRHVLRIAPQGLIDAGVARSAAVTVTIAV